VLGPAGFDWLLLDAEHSPNDVTTLVPQLMALKDSASAPVAVVVQIESRKGVAAIDEICEVDGVDGVFIGPSDLAAGFGHLGNPQHPEVQAAMQRVLDAARAQQRAVGILATVEADARRYLELGATMVAVGSDLGLFRAATAALRKQYLA